MGDSFEFVDAGGYQDERWWHPDDWRWVQAEHVVHPLFWERHAGVWYWRGMFNLSWRSRWHGPST